MRTAVTKAMFIFAAKAAGPLSRIINESVRGGVLQLTVAESKMSAAGYEIRYQERTHTVNCRVFLKVNDKDALVAAGTSDSRDDALMHALYGAAYEEDAAVEVSKELAKLGPLQNVDHNTRVQMQTAYVNRRIKEIAATGR